MIPKVLYSFVRQLQSKTEEDELRWNEADSLSFFCDHKNHTLHISSRFDEDREISYYNFRIVTGNKSTPFAVRDDEEDYEMMRKLFEAVVANANDVGKDISNFFD